MDLDTIKDSFERVAKKQKTSSSKSEELISQVGREIEQALARIQSCSDSTISVDQKPVLNELKAKLQAVNPHTHLEEPQQELNMNLSRFQKALEKQLHPDISKACIDIDLDRHILNQIIISHFYYEGLFDIVDCLIKEAGESEDVSLRLQYQEIHQILEAIRSKNLDPASKWISASQEKLKDSDLELKLHKLHFVGILQNRGQVDGLMYAIEHLAPLAMRHMKEFQRLICGLVWTGRLDNSPYADLVDPLNWDRFAEQLMRTFRSFTGQSGTDPLSVSIAAGAEGLPTLLKLANVMAANKQEWEAMKQLPVPTELGKEFQYRSVFVCPVSREQGNNENPPMLLLCGHALCKQSIVKLSKGNSRNFKCPYCPMVTSLAQCQQLWF